MMWRLSERLVFALALALLAACTSRPVSLTPTPGLVGPGESKRLPLDAGDEPTVERPKLQLNVEVTDKQTGQRVNTAVISVDGQPEARGCCVVIVFEASVPHTLTVTSPGYHLYEVEINPHIKHDAVMTAPVQLEPLKPEARRGASPNQERAEPAVRKRGAPCRPACEVLGAREARKGAKCTLLKRQTACQKSLQMISIWEL